MKANELEEYLYVVQDCCDAIEAEERSYEHSIWIADASEIIGSLAIDGFSMEYRSHTSVDEVGGTASSGTPSWRAIALRISCFLSSMMDGSEGLRGSRGLVPSSDGAFPARTHAVQKGASEPVSLSRFCFHWSGVCSVSLRWSLRKPGGSGPDEDSEVDMLRSSNCVNLSRY